MDHAPRARRPETDEHHDDRQELADALLEVGPHAPTLCEGWTAHDLAAHLVARERRPDSIPGNLLSPMAGWSERIRQGLLRQPLPALVEQLRDGPPPWSPFALPGVDRSANVVEYFVHLEDVRRAEPGWRPRELPPQQRTALWRAVRRSAGHLYRSSYPDLGVGVVLVVPDGPRRKVLDGEESVVVTGQPEELLLHAFGRGRQALVEVSGPDSPLSAATA